jgi:hypothetical protein
VNEVVEVDDTYQTPQIIEGFQVFLNFSQAKPKTSLA